MKTLKPVIWVAAIAVTAVAASCVSCARNGVSKAEEYMRYLQV